MKSVVHNFQEKLDWSNTLSGEAAWVPFWRRVFPDAISIQRLDANCDWQHAGVDRAITLPKLKTIYVDEKKRDTVYTDFLAEIWSVYRNNRGEKIGWARDPKKICDLIAYAIPRAGKCYLLPFEILRITVEDNWKSWLGSSKPRMAGNVGYQTYNVPVSWDRLFADMRRVQEQGFGNTLALPVPELTPDQATFQW